MIICWWSGGITSAVACKIAIETYGIDKCRVVFMDTHNEHPDTYRFKDDCSKWYGLKIETISAIPSKYSSIKDVWRKWKSLNVAHGAICSSELKRVVREKWQETIEYDHQVFGFEFEKKEFNRAMSMKLNHPKTKAIFPLLLKGLDKDDCIKIVKEAGIEIPMMYRLGFSNNNCFQTMCVQGGIGYWQKVKDEFPDKFDAMAELEHELTDLSGFPVTMLKDQSNSAKEKAKLDKYSNLVFLKKHKDYPNKTISDFKKQEVKPLNDCNGFCGIDEMNPKNETEKEINFSQMELL